MGRDRTGYGGQARLLAPPLVDLVCPALAVAGLVFWIGAGQTLSYTLAGCTQASDGSLSVPGDRACAVVFDDGTAIALEKAARGRVHALWFRRGAQLVLQNGHAALSVFHRPLGRWEVLAGPIAVRVTGTKFAVDWTPGQGRFHVEVSQGEVSVSGGPLRGPTSVRVRHTLDVNTVTADVIESDMGEPAGAQAKPVRPVAAESPKRTATESAAVSAQRFALSASEARRAVRPRLAISHTSRNEDPGSDA